MQGDCLIGLDAGTTGVTAVLFDQELRPLGSFSREFTQHFPRPGWVEHSADEILEAVDVVLEQAVALAGKRLIAAIGVTNQRETVFAVDRDTGQALAKGIVWQDRRTAERCAALFEHSDQVRRLTGLQLDPYFSATKIEWLLENVRGLGARAEAGGVCFATVDSLVVRHLTGGPGFLTDVTNASRTMLFDLEQRCWSKALCELFGVQESWLPEVLGSVGAFGEWQGIPIHGVAGDQQAALFGQSAWSRGQAKCTFGTGSFLLVNSGPQRPVCPKGLLTTLAVGLNGEVAYAIEGSVFMAGAIVQWLRDQLGIIESAAMSERLAGTVEDTGGVYLIPAFTGLGAPYWDPEARAALVGMTRGTGRAEIVRAGLEAIGFQNAELIELVRREVGIELKQLLVDGGASGNDLLMQMQADLAGVQIVRPDVVEATARGAAALAGLGAELWSFDGLAAIQEAPHQEWAPRLSDEDRGARMTAWRAAVKRVLS